MFSNVNMGEIESEIEDSVLKTTWTTIETGNGNVVTQLEMITNLPTTQRGCYCFQ